MRTYLLDVNLLIALTWPNHIHHAQAKEWFKNKGQNSWATCPITQSGFIRISSNPACIEEATAVSEAILFLTELTGHRGHVFWPDTLSAVHLKDLPYQMLQGYRQVTDSYLLLLAKEHGGTLATLDRKIASNAHGTEFDAIVSWILA